MEKIFSNVKKRSWKCKVKGMMEGEPEMTDDMEGELDGVRKKEKRK